MDIQQAEIRPDFNWTDEQIDRLKALLAEGKTRSQIASEFDLTRNAISGKVNRLGLRGHSQPRPKLPRDEVKRRRLANQRDRRQRLGNGKLAPFVPAEPPPPTDFLAITFDELNVFSSEGVNQCRYPHGEGTAIRFCGQRTPAGEAFCLHCYRICCPPEIQRGVRR